MKEVCSLLLTLCLLTEATAQTMLRYNATAARLPANVEASERVDQILEKIWRRSATFREQCRRIATEPSLTISLSFVAPSLNIRSRALSHATRHPDGRMTVQIQIFRHADYVELIGHEFEHVLEQIEGVNLKTLAATGAAGVSCDERGFFETSRAISAGRKVYLEYRNNSQADSTISFDLRNRQPKEKSYDSDQRYF
jgi:hypothetical protein